MTTSPLTDAAERFARDVADHQLTVLHDDGLYRHLRFKQPDRGGYWFDIVTWPGSLAVRGDMGGGYVFSRTQDMFEFFRTSEIGLPGAGIHPDYWAEKLQGGRRSVQEYSEEALRDTLDPYLVEYERDYQPRGGVMTPAEARDLIGEYDASGDLYGEDGARRLLAELERAGVVSGTWEWALKTWTYEFLWFCNAILWGIRQYDDAQSSAAEVETPA